MGSQTLELKWANHKSNMASELQELYLNDALLDVTIACGEFTLKAHKTVLSASSTFFRKLFISNPCKHPILIMTDVDFGDLKSIIEFMYQGEVHISRDKLTQFLKTADRLKIKGLTSIEDMNLNTPEHFEVDVDPQYSCGTWEDTSAQSQSQLQTATQVEDTHSSPRKMTECVQKDSSQEILESVQSDTDIKVEHETSQPANDDCMYWQSECFDQSSSSVVPDHSLPSTSNVSHQPPSSVSQVPLPHQLSASSVSHQLSPSSMSHQLSTSIPSDHGVPLNNEGFTFSESQTDRRMITQVQGESTGREIIPVSLYQSQDQSPITVPTSSKSFEATESINSQPSQSGSTGNETYPSAKEPIGISVGTSHTEESRNNDTVLIQREGSTPFICTFCEKAFTDHVELQKHLRLHSESQQFICDFCNGSFSSKDNLREHMRTHFGEKPFSCEVCKHRFSSKSSVNIHMRMHTGEKPFICQVCNKAYKQAHGLRYHERMHRGEKPFQCSYCNRRFRSRSYLNEHERKYCHHRKVK